MHLFFRSGMHERDFRGMKHKPFSRNSSIQPVAHYRCVQSVRVRSMYTQLVRTACKREEINEDLAVRILLPYGKACESRLAVCCIYHLPRAVEGIRQKRQFYPATESFKSLLRGRLYDSFIPFQNIAPLEIRLKSGIDLRRFG